MDGNTCETNTCPLPYSAEYRPEDCSLSSTDHAPQDQHIYKSSLTGTNYEPTASQYGFGYDPYNTDYYYCPDGRQTYKVDQADNSGIQSNIETMPESNFISSSNAEPYNLPYHQTDQAYYPTEYISANQELVPPMDSISANPAAYSFGESVYAQPFLFTK